MPLTATQLVTLKTEFQTDPRGYGYAGQMNPRNDDMLARLINFARDGVTVPPAGVAGQSIKINQATVNTGLIRGATTLGAFGGLNVDEKDWFSWLTANGEIPVNAETLQQLAGVPDSAGSMWLLADRPAMNAAMEAIMRKWGSRAEELFGRGTVVSIDDVGKALNLV
jgi:hypothetical protein